MRIIRRKTIALMMTMLLLIATIPFTGVAHAATISTKYDNDPSISDLENDTEGYQFPADLAKYKYNSGKGDGLKEDPNSDFEVYLVFGDDKGNQEYLEVSFQTEYPVYFVFVKNGDGGNLYYYSSPVTSGTVRVKPGNPMKDISHVTFYFSGKTVPTYTVTYDANGGTGAQTDPLSPYEAGATVTVLDKGTMARANYTFNGWNTAANGTGTPYIVADTFTMTAANVVLYAQWVEDEKFTVTYNANGGTGTQTDVLSPYYAGETVTVLGQGTIARTNYSFNGWNTAANGTGTPYIAGATFDMPAASVILYAQWVEDGKYAVTYNANGGTGTQTDVLSPYYAGETVTVLGQGTIARVNYSFNGWNTAANGTGTPYIAGATFDMTAANVTLFAQWVEDNKFTVTYNANGGTGTQTDVLSPYYAGETVTVLGQGTIARVNYSFNGWNTAANGTGTPYIAGATFDMTAANVTLFAQWQQQEQPTTYTVTYQPGTQGTFAVQSTSGLQAGVATPTPPTATGNAGYNFVGWSPTWSSTVTGNAIYTAQWSPITQPVFYTVTYDPGTQGTFAAQVNSGLSFGATTPAAPTVTGNEGYTFIGWSPTVSATVTASVTYTAQWEAVPAPIFYTVVADAEIGGSATGGGTFLAGSTATVIATPEDGYDFLGWEENGVVVSTSLVYSFEVDRDYDLLATFELELDDPIIPEAPELPETGELPFTIFYGIGALISAAGIAVGKKRRARS